MTLPTGSISFSQINTEINRPATQTLSIDDPTVRQVANVSSGAISMNNLRGKSYLSVSGGSTLVSGDAGRVGAGSVTTTTSQASVGTITGGVSPYTYLWEHVSGDVANISSPNASITTFSRSVNVSIGESITKSGIYRCRITDNNGVVVYGPNCTVTTNHTENS